MSNTKKYAFLFLLTSLILSLGFLSVVPSVGADHLSRAVCEAEFEPGPELNDCLHITATANTGGTNVECTNDDSGNFNECFPDGLATLGDEPNPITENLVRIINFLSVGIGIVVTTSVVVAAIQWTTSGGNPQKRQAALGRIWNAAIALIIFVFGWALLNWFIPGGVLNQSGGGDTPPPVTPGQPS